MGWLSLLDGFLGWHGLAQTGTPKIDLSKADPATIEFLKQQLDVMAKQSTQQAQVFEAKIKFLAEENKQLNESFRTFLTAVTVGSSLIGGLAVFSVGFLSFLFGKTYKDVEKTAKAAVTRQVEDRMAAIADNRIELVQRSLERETVIDRARVAFCLLDGTAPPKEFEVLKMRGFSVDFCRDITGRSRADVDVAVLDLNNWQDAAGKKFSPFEADAKAEVKRQVDLLRGWVPNQSTVIVVYVKGRFDYLDEVGQSRLVAPTNNPVTLVGMVVNAAYLVANNR